MESLLNINVFLKMNHFVVFIYCPNDVLSMCYLKPLNSLSDLQDLGRLCVNSGKTFLSYKYMAVLVPFDNLFLKE